VRKIGLLWLFATLSAASRGVWAGPPPPLIRHEATRMSMAAPYAIVAYGPDAQALAAAAAAALDEVDRIDRLMSHYKPESPLSRLNREAARGPVQVDAELFDFIAECLRYSRESGGAFDVTVGPLMKAWGFFRGEGRLPSEGELEQARGRIGYQHVILDHAPRTIRFDRPGMELDLGGIAKGYAVDRAVAVLRAHHVPAALVSAGGSTVYGLGAPPGRDAWEVALQDPVAASRTAFTVPVRDRAVSVSGTHEKAFEVGGVTYSHVMDPRTGRPVPDVLGVAVLTDTGTAGDALDNALFVQGVTEARTFVARMRDTEAFFFLPAFLPAGGRQWKMVHLTGRVPTTAQREVERSTTP
jgi:thiamine biosynthesis lipoprotein